MLEMTPNGLYCGAGDFYVDPHRRVDRAVITHAHSDHARRGSDHYLAHPHTAALMRKRLGKNLSIQEVEYGTSVDINGVSVSLHPAGHVAGSSQIRMEHRGEVWVVTGDYKREEDPVSAPFEVVRCDTFITECTFGLPIYQWPDPTQTVDHMNIWWRSNRDHGMISVIRGYSLGKAQRILSSIDPSIGPIYVSKPIDEMNRVLRDCDYALPKTVLLNDDPSQVPAGALVVTSTALETDGRIPIQVADASGWLAVQRHRRSRQQSFVMSDHVDWNDLLQTIRETECEKVLTMHGFTAPLSRYLRELGYDSTPLEGGEGRTKSFYAALTTERAMAIREETCEATGLPRWMFDECYGHTRSLRETAALMTTGVFEPQRRTPLKPPAEEQEPEIALGTTHLKCVLYHLHRQPGGRHIGKVTMGVWSGDEVLPLVHVHPEIDREMMQIILAFAEEHTTVQVGPVRTIEPRFVFTVAVEGLSLAPRRKVGVRVHGARIVQAHLDADPKDAVTIDAIRELAQGADQ